ncbi:MAG: adenylate/guanylate cyclase domain-containing protein [Saprospiraceae bacterium]
MKPGSNDITREDNWLRAFFRRVARLWESVVRLGVYEQMSNWERKRTRLINGISLVAALTYLGFIASYLDPEHRTTLYESLISFVFYLVPLILNHFRRYLAAIFTFNIFSTLIYTFYAISHGVVDAAEYLLLCSSVASMLFFRSIWVILFFFLLNFSCFWLCKWSFSAMQPFLFMPGGQTLYIENHVFTFLILFLMIYYFKSENKRQENLLKRQNVVLSKEKQKSDSLLLNILPFDTAEELKETGRAEAKRYEQVTVMFTDFQNFTQVAERLAPEELVALINHYFSAFDRIIGAYRIEKIKTIGDAYLCVGGLPEPNTTHPEDVVSAAFDILDFVQTEKAQRSESGLPFFDLRIGIHTGPVVAGIVGITKFAYDIWGDTVNIAARMESSGVVGKVNVSETTCQLVRERFRCTSRGKIEAKNKGEVQMYFVERR